MKLQLTNPTPQNTDPDDKEVCLSPNFTLTKLSPMCSFYKDM